MRTFYSLALVLSASAAYAQRYELGVQGGLSMYTTARVQGANGASATAGFRSGVAAGFTLGHNMYNRLGGEVRYTYVRNDIKLEAGSQDASFGSRAHAFHYDLLFHTSGFGSRVRPYVAAGGGFKQYTGTGADRAFQPLSEFAVLTRTSQIRPMLSAGGGVKIAIGKKVLFRLDIHDFITPVPSRLIAPVPGAKISGILHNLVPTAGISATF